MLGSEGQALSRNAAGQASGWVLPEVASVSWRKSSRSTYNGNCVEVGKFRDGQIGVRDTKDREKGPVLVFPSSQWNAFLADVVRGNFDFH